MCSLGRYEVNDTLFGSNGLTAEKTDRGYGVILVLLSGERNKICRTRYPAIEIGVGQKARGRALISNYRDFNL